MAIINSIVMGKARGSIGNATLAIVGGDTIARQKIAKGTGGGVVRSYNQMRRRVTWANMVNLWQNFGGNDRPSFQTRANRVSDFNRFIQSNLGGRPVYLTKEEARQGGCVAADYQVSEGELASREIVAGGTNGEIHTDISLGSLTISEATTIGQFSIAIRNANPEFLDGDQITVFVAEQTTNSVTGVPYVKMTSAKVILDSSDEENLLSDIDPEGLFFAVTPGTNKLGMSQAINGAVVYIHSRREQGIVKVSTQAFVATNTVLNSYITDAKKTAAIQSYGGKLTGYYLDPNVAAIQTV